MHAWEQIQKTVDYIEENLSEEIKIEKLAHMAALSQFYFQRLFSRLAKRPVNEYVKLRRLAKASEAVPCAIFSAARTSVVLRKSSLENTNYCCRANCTKPKSGGFQALSGKTKPPTDKILFINRW